MAFGRTQFVSLVLCSIFSWVGTAMGAELPSGPEAEALRLGERMYRLGILPSGAPMQAFVKGDVPVDGTAFTCVSCHLRSGLGSFEGNVITPPTNGASLFQPLKIVNKGAEVLNMPPRPAYTEEALSSVIMEGVAPSGRKINEVMPRYLLNDQEMTILSNYLKTLSAEISPGVSPETIKFATVSTEEVSPQEYKEMVTPLERLVVSKNNSVEAYRVNPRQARMAESMLRSPEIAHKKIALSHWRLKGAPETWRRQLEEYNRQDPVFALLGGISTGDWQPIHEFCESNHIPSLFPITDYPVISKSDWYTVYFSKGYGQEGEGAARYLAGQEALKERPVVEVVRDSRTGKALAAGFENTWRELGRPAPITVTVAAGETINAEFLEQLQATHKPAALILWDDGAALPALTKLAAAPAHPELLLLSSTYLGPKNTEALPAPLRDLAYLTYPFRLPQDEAKPRAGIAPEMAKAGEITKQMAATVQLVNRVLMDMRGQYYRDNFLDVLGMVEDQVVPLYERLSFGPGQRYASKGCYIVQLGPGEAPELLKKSEWVIH